MEVHLYFRISKEAGMSNDGDGQATETYLRATIKAGSMTDEQVTKAICFDPLKPEHLTRISAAEYYTATEEA